MKKKKVLVLSMVSIIILLVLSITGCEQREANMVSHNLSLEADNFNIVRQLTVINCIQGDVLFQMTGKMSINADTTDNQLEITVKDENGQYQKHFIGLSDNVTYVVEDIRASSVDPYNYTLKYNPKMWLPIYVEKVN